ncbi:uncharacterized protein LOC130644639 isoform X2 [Hydractinia symbiolongicarpus]|uniref:uncharacterized protein LOC130644639 isoform X2 n=1 Tax=Hydractinia symbiolongicarpus TaxID=13093 RepID=UPI00254CF31E|nr:uncharacterized protein LOC130644639 isoform X2 [Hydractinia symbiolongicarpus]
MITTDHLPGKRFLLSKTEIVARGSRSTSTTGGSNKSGHLPQYLTGHIRACNFIVGEASAKNHKLLIEYDITGNIEELKIHKLRRQLLIDYLLVEVPNSSRRSPALVFKPLFDAVENDWVYVQYFGTRKVEKVVKTSLYPFRFKESKRECEASFVSEDLASWLRVAKTQLLFLKGPYSISPCTLDVYNFAKGGKFQATLVHHDTFNRTFSIMDSENCKSLKVDPRLSQVKFTCSDEDLNQMLIGNAQVKKHFSRHSQKGNIKMETANTMHWRPPAWMASESYLQLISTMKEKDRTKASVIKVNPKKIRCSRSSRSSSTSSTLSAGQKRNTGSTAGSLDYAESLSPSSAPGDLNEELRASRLLRFLEISSAEPEKPSRLLRFFKISDGNSSGIQNQTPVENDRHPSSPCDQEIEEDYSSTNAGVEEDDVFFDTNVNLSKQNVHEHAETPQENVIPQDVDKPWNDMHKEIITLDVHGQEQAISGYKLPIQDLQEGKATQQNVCETENVKTQDYSDSNVNGKPLETMPVIGNNSTSFVNGHLRKEEIQQQIPMGINTREDNLDAVMSLAEISNVTVGMVNDKSIPDHSSRSKELNETKPVKRNVLKVNLESSDSHNAVEYHPHCSSEKEMLKVNLCNKDLPSSEHSIDLFQKDQVDITTSDNEKFAHDENCVEISYNGKIADIPSHNHTPEVSCAISRSEVSCRSNIINVSCSVNTTAVTFPSNIKRTLCSNNVPIVFSKHNDPLVSSPVNIKEISRSSRRTEFPHSSKITVSCSNMQDAPISSNSTILCSSIPEVPSSSNITASCSNMPVVSCSSNTTKVSCYGDIMDVSCNSNITKVKNEQKGCTEKTPNNLLNHTLEEVNFSKMASESLIVNEVSDQNSTTRTPKKHSSGLKPINQLDMLRIMYSEIDKSPSSCSTTSTPIKELTPVKKQAIHEEAKVPTNIQNLDVSAKGSVTPVKPVATCGFNSVSSSTNKTGHHQSISDANSTCDSICVRPDQEQLSEKIDMKSITESTKYTTKITEQRGSVVEYPYESHISNGESTVTKVYEKTIVKHIISEEIKLKEVSTHSGCNNGNSWNSHDTGTASKQKLSSFQKRKNPKSPVTLSLESIKEILEETRKLSNPYNSEHMQSFDAAKDNFMPLSSIGISSKATNCESTAITALERSIGSINSTEYNPTTNSDSKKCDFVISQSKSKINFQNHGSSDKKSKNQRQKVSKRRSQKKYHPPAENSESAVVRSNNSCPTATSFKEMAKKNYSHLSQGGFIDSTGEHYEQNQMHANKTLTYRESFQFSRSSNSSNPDYRQNHQLSLSQQNTLGDNKVENWSNNELLQIMQAKSGPTSYEYASIAYLQAYLSRQKCTTEYLEEELIKFSKKKRDNNTERLENRLKTFLYVSKLPTLQHIGSEDFFVGDPNLKWDFIYQKLTSFVARCQQELSTKLMLRNGMPGCYSHMQQKMYNAFDSQNFTTLCNHNNLPQFQSNQQYNFNNLNYISQLMQSQSNSSLNSSQDMLPYCHNDHFQATPHLSTIYNNYGNEFYNRSLSDSAAAEQEHNQIQNSIDYHGLNAILPDGYRVTDKVPDVMASSSETPITTSVTYSTNMPCISKRAFSYTEGFDPCEIRKSQYFGNSSSNPMLHAVNKIETKSNTAASIFSSKPSRKKRDRITIENYMSSYHNDTLPTKTTGTLKDNAEPFAVQTTPNTVTSAGYEVNPFIDLNTTVHDAFLDSLLEKYPISYNTNPTAQIFENILNDTDNIDESGKQETNEASDLHCSVVTSLKEKDSKPVSVIMNTPIAKSEKLSETGQTSVKKDFETNNTNLAKDKIPQTKLEISHVCETAETSTKDPKYNFAVSHPQTTYYAKANTCKHPSYRFAERLGLDKSGLSLTAPRKDQVVNNLEIRKSESYDKTISTSPGILTKGAAVSSLPKLPTNELMHQEVPCCEKLDKGIEDTKVISTSSLGANVKDSLSEIKKAVPNQSFNDITDTSIAAEVVNEANNFNEVCRDSKPINTNGDGRSLSDSSTDENIGEKFNNVVSEYIIALIGKNRKSVRRRPSLKRPDTFVNEDNDPNAPCVTSPNVKPPLPTSTPSVATAVSCQNSPRLQTKQHIKKLQKDEEVGKSLGDSKEYTDKGFNCKTPVTENNKLQAAADLSISVSKERNSPRIIKVIEVKDPAYEAHYKQMNKRLTLPQSCQIAGRRCVKIFEVTDSHDDLKRMIYNSPLTLRSSEIHRTNFSATRSNSKASHGAATVTTCINKAPLSSSFPLMSPSVFNKKQSEKKFSTSSLATPIHNPRSSSMSTSFFIQNILSSVNKTSPTNLSSMQNVIANNRTCSNEIFQTNTALSVGTTKHTQLHEGVLSSNGKTSMRQGTEELGRVSKAKDQLLPVSGPLCVASYVASEGDYRNIKIVDTLQKLKNSANIESRQWKHPVGNDGKVSLHTNSINKVCDACPLSVEPISRTLNHMNKPVTTTASLAMSPQTSDSSLALVLTPATAAKASLSNVTLAKSGSTEKTQVGNGSVSSASPLVFTPKVLNEMKAATSAETNTRTDASVTKARTTSALLFNNFTSTSPLSFTVPRSLLSPMKGQDLKSLAGKGMRFVLQGKSLLSSSPMLLTPTSSSGYQIRFLTLPKASIKPSFDAHTSQFSTKVTSQVKPVNFFMPMGKKGETLESKLNTSLSSLSSSVVTQNKAAAKFPPNLSKSITKNNKESRPRKRRHFDDSDKNERNALIGDIKVRRSSRSVATDTQWKMHQCQVAEEDAEDEADSSETSQKKDELNNKTELDEEFIRSADAQNAGKEEGESNCNTKLGEKDGKLKDNMELGVREIKSNDIIKQGTDEIKIFSSQVVTSTIQTVSTTSANKRFTATIVHGKIPTEAKITSVKMSPLSLPLIPFKYLLEQSKRSMPNSTVSNLSCTTHLPTTEDIRAKPSQSNVLPIKPEPSKTPCKASVENDFSPPGSPPKSPPVHLAVPSGVNHVLLPPDVIEKIKDNKVRCEYVDENVLKSMKNMSSETSTQSLTSKHTVSTSTPTKMKAAGVKAGIKNQVSGVSSKPTTGCTNLTVSTQVPVKSKLNKSNQVISALVSQFKTFYGDKFAGFDIYEDNGNKYLRIKQTTDGEMVSISNTIISNVISSLNAQSNAPNIVKSNQETTSSPTSGDKKLTSPFKVLLTDCRKPPGKNLKMSSQRMTKEIHQEELKPKKKKQRYYFPGDEDIKSEPNIGEIVKARRGQSQEKSRKRERKIVSSSDDGVNRKKLRSSQIEQKSWLQTTTCDNFPKLPKCVDCKEGTADAYCRFTMFRRLVTTDTGRIRAAGFCTADAAEKEDLLHWVYNNDVKLDLGICKQILRHVGMQFQQLVVQEIEAQKQGGKKGENAWKRAVLRVREMCDICATTIFNTHWTCDKCGFGVCLDCFKAAYGQSSGKENNSFLDWPLCDGGDEHNANLLTVTEIIPKNVLLDLHKDMLNVCKQIGLKFRQLDLLEFSHHKVCSDVQKTIEPVTNDLDLLATVANFEQQDSSIVSDCERNIFENYESIKRQSATECEWYCDNKMLHIQTPRFCEETMKLFKSEWLKGKPIIVSNVHRNLNEELWKPESFCRDFGNEKSDIVNCYDGTIIENYQIDRFWKGFECVAERPVFSSDLQHHVTLLKLKDWPPGDDFKEKLPARFADMMQALPAQSYTNRTGELNLAARLPDFFAVPDLGPKMYNAYGSASYPSAGTTNLHLDISDATNVICYVGIPIEEDVREKEINDTITTVNRACCEATKKRIQDPNVRPGALWHIFPAHSADKIRCFLRRIAEERNTVITESSDPIHDQSFYMDQDLLDRLREEEGVVGNAICQCLGDAVFIPAGAPHQVLNLHSCIKVAEDFVAPEHITHCFQLTEEFRHLSDYHTNHEDKLQIKNIIFHSVKDCLGVVKKHYNL